MNTLYPLSLNAYYLDFSYPGQFTVETRLFITLPYAGQAISENKITDLLEICLEMNSVFGKKGYEPPNKGIDIGLKVMIGNTNISMPKEKLKENFEHALTQQNPTHSEHYFFETEQDLYKNLVPALSKFISEAYSDNWIDFAQKCREKYMKKTPVIYLTKEEKDENIYLQKESDKINKFIGDALERVQLILNASKVDEELFKELNMSVNGGSGIASQILGTVPINERTEVIELGKVIKTLQYFTLSDELENQNSSKPKVKKI